MNIRLAWPCTLAALLSACAPALDWRELRPADSDVRALFPCKADSHARQVTLGDQTVRMELYACTAGGITWALAQADVGDPARVGTALLELRGAAVRNLGAAQAPRTLELKVPGVTPNDHAAILEIRGHLPDGRAVIEQMAVFAKGTRVFQATALGETLPADAADTFFDGLRAGP